MQGNLILTQIMAKNKEIQEYSRSSEFFLTSTKYIDYAEDIRLSNINASQVSSIMFQCTGHGSFNKTAVASRFINHLQQALQHMKEVRKLKLKISGFDLRQPLKLNFGLGIDDEELQNCLLINNLCKLISKKSSELQQLEIRISNVQNCRIEYASSIMKLGLNQQAKSLTVLSYQFSDWSFIRKAKQLPKKAPKEAPEQVSSEAQKEAQRKKSKKQLEIRDLQPQLHVLIKCLENVCEQAVGYSFDWIKKFRLQISTWYYTQAEYDDFLANIEDEQFENLFINNKKVESKTRYFHYKFKQLLKTLIVQILPEMNDFQLDLRNWNKKFDMNQLKNDIMNISSGRGASMSAITKKAYTKTDNIRTSLKSKIDPQGLTAIVEQKTQEKVLDMIVII